MVLEREVEWVGAVADGDVVAATGVFELSVQLDGLVAGVAALFAYDAIGKVGVGGFGDEGFGVGCAWFGLIGRVWVFDLGGLGVGLVDTNGQRFFRCICNESSDG